MRHSEQFDCPDAVDAIHSVAPEGQYELDIEIVEGPAPAKAAPRSHDAGETLEDDN